jgi:hypothetical protein
MFKGQIAERLNSVKQRQRTGAVHFKRNGLLVEIGFVMRTPLFSLSCGGRLARRI